MSSICENTEILSDDVKNVREKEYITQFTEITDNFEVIDKIGEGSFASVFSVKSKKCESLKEKFALKFTIPTIDPKRIVNELRILKKLGGRKNVIKLHMAFRVRDHIFMLMPFVDHLKFADYYLLMDANEIRDYLKNLLIALKYVHENKIIHRDVKPNNFLYDRLRKRCILVDFGLAHSELHGDLGSWFDDESDISNENIQVVRVGSSSNFQSTDTDSLKCNVAETSEADVSPETTSCICGNRLVSCSGCRSRPRQEVRRGGTIGYRPPEVMMRHAEQTTAVDVWAVGIIMAIFLTGRFPLFRVEDDTDVMMSLAYFLSLEKMQAGARDIGRRIIMEPKPKPIIGDFDEWLELRCTNIRQNCPKIAKMSREDSRTSCLYGNEYVFTHAAYDLLSRLLEPVYRTRITCREALQHPYFTSN